MRHKKLFSLALLLGLLHTLHLNAQNRLVKNTDSVSFYLGYLSAKQILGSFSTGFNADAFSEGVKRAADPSIGMVSDGEANAFLQKYFTGMQKKVNQVYLEEGRKFLAENAKKPGVTTLPNGLQYRVIKQGTGDKPQASDEVEVFYHGSLTDGTVFDSAKDRGEPVVFPVTRVIAGFSEALQLMSEGAIWEIYIPAELAYGENVNPQSGIKPNSALIFEINLLRIVKKESAIPQAAPNFLH